MTGTRKEWKKVWKKAEQNAKKALSIADRAYVLETGKIVLEGKASDLLNNDSIKKAYLGE